MNECIGGLIQKINDLNNQLYILQKKVYDITPGSCINPAYSLTGYTVTLETPSGETVTDPGLITYYQVVITNSIDSSRVWNFTIGGSLQKKAFWIVFQFDPNCVVPNNTQDPTDNFAKLSMLDFVDPIVGGKNTNIQGTILINNQAIYQTGNAPMTMNGPKAPPYVVNYDWDATNATYTLKFNLVPWLEQNPDFVFVEGQENPFLMQFTVLDGLICWICLGGSGCSNCSACLANGQCIKCSC